MTNQQPETLDEILVNLWQGDKFYTKYPEGGAAAAMDNRIVEAKAAINAHTRAICGEVIGQNTERKLHYFDEVEQQKVYYNDETASIRATENKLRAEQRERLNKLLGSNPKNE
jgi:hypothetical protein